MIALNANLLQEITDRLVREFQPERVILFGSRAWGVPNEDSDVDLLVIVPDSDASPARRAQRAQRSLGALQVAADILVKTRAETDRLSRVATSIVSQALTKGRILYG